MRIYVSTGFLLNDLSVSSWAEGKGFKKSLSGKHRGGKQSDVTRANQKWTATESTAEKGGLDLGCRSRAQPQRHNDIEDGDLTPLLVSFRRTIGGSSTRLAVC